MYTIQKVFFFFKTSYNTISTKLSILSEFGLRLNVTWWRDWGNSLVTVILTFLFIFTIC